VVLPAVGNKVHVGLHAQGLHPGPSELLTERGRLFAVKLQKIHRYTSKYTPDALSRFIDEQRHHGNERGNSRDNLRRLRGRYSPGAGRVKDQADGIRATVDRHAGIFRRRDATNLDSRVGHLLVELGLKTRRE
jgi:hypothetical protein